MDGLVFPEDIDGKDHRVVIVPVFCPSGEGDSHGFCGVCGRNGQHLRQSEGTFSIFSSDNHVLFPQPGYGADKLMEIFMLFQVIPVEPGDLIVLTVGIVVALLRVQELVSGQNHGHAPAEEEDRHGVLRQLFPEGKDTRIFGFSLGAAVPAAVVIGPVRIVPAVGFIMLSPVGIQVMKGKAVVAGDKVYGSVVASVVRVIDISGAGDPVCGCLPHAVIAL